MHRRASGRLCCENNSLCYMFMSFQRSRRRTVATSTKGQATAKPMTTRFLGLLRMPFVRPRSKLEHVKKRHVIAPNRGSDSNGEKNNDLYPGLMFRGLAELVDLVTDRADPAACRPAGTPPVRRRTPARRTAHTTKPSVTRHQPSQVTSVARPRPGSPSDCSP